MTAFTTKPCVRLSGFCWFMLTLVLVGGTGCGSFMARRMVQAPNSYPSWLAPKARVVLGFNSRFLTNFPVSFAEVGPPAARLRYRIVEPADYDFTVTSTHSLEHGKPHSKFAFRAVVPGKTNQWTVTPRGTVVLLHGYGLGQFAMVPWAVRLAEEGWRCVLVDLRGHGRSTGNQIYFGTVEARDLSQLVDALTSASQLRLPVMTMGESYGAALALRWRSIDPRVRTVVAIAPYAELSPAVLNICHEYADWMPVPLVKAGLDKLPALLRIEGNDLDTSSILTRNPISALFIAGADDRITPVNDVERLSRLAAPGSKLIVVPHASHEAVTYFFDELAGPIENWLEEHQGR